MRSPEHRSYTNRTGQNYDNEISSRYNKPGAFTILPPEEVVPPDPPLAPQPYRLTPSSRRHKNLSFAILAEPSSVPGSRSPSPTGRVSPFRGRGFNPIGSRHASPNPSPPPPEVCTPANDSPQHSKIPKLSRRGSAVAFGEKITDFQSSPNRRKLNSQLSQSLTNIASSKKVSNRPPPSPRRPQAYNKNVAFQRLSPIAGSSPEPSQSQSSPKITSSQQQSKFNSPGRSQSFVNRTSRNTSRPTSKTPSRNVSRDPSPKQNPTSPTRIPVKSYRNVQAKVNSFSRVKPKVPPKPQVLNEETTTTDSDNNVNTRRKADRKESVKLRTNSKSNVVPKSVGKNNNNNKTNNKNVTKDSNGNNVNSKNGNSSTSTSNNNKTNTPNKNGDGNSNGNKTNRSENETKEKSSPKKTTKNTNKDSELDTITTVEDSSESEPKPKASEGMKKSESAVKLSDILQPSTTAVVSTTTNTVTQPLKIEAKIDLEQDNKNFSPIVDGRILSATSVSNAMNKMNDTVLNTQTLMKETGLPTPMPKLSPAASTIIAMGNEAKQTNPALDTKNATTALPTVDTVTTKTAEAPTTNHVTSTGIIPARVLDEHVRNNMSKLISPEHVGNSLQKGEKMKEVHDVKPIRITVKEKPMDVEVQSGNVRFDTANGLNERPGLPPPQQPTNDPQTENPEPQKQNACTRFLSSCKQKMSCKRCKKEKSQEKEELKKNVEEQEKTTGCFNCRKKKPDVTISIEEDEPKPKFWDRLKCCGKNKVSDTGCFPTGKRKGSWAERKDNKATTEQAPGKKSNKCSKDCCTGILRKMFCLDKCRKKKKMQSFDEGQISRRASMLSKKKSLTPVPVEDNTPKLDMSLVEHTSQMKAAIPVLPVCLAWFCLVMNCIAPGTGTILSGLFCLCIGIPRFSQKDGPRPRIGAFLINLIIGFGQFFTVLFCLVGWGWSIWWGVIMLKLAKKYRKIKALEANAEEESNRQVPAGPNAHSRDPERGS